MSGSEEENELFCFYGKPLEPYDEDSVPKRRPITVEDQIATDAQGRRRFHGAFTGGFSAGFFNTVGSLEGWRPSQFKSSRSEKSKSLSQKPQDFMDDEDLGEDGFAPQMVKATSDYDTSNKKRRREFNEGPIPGEPVLHNILTSGNETVGYMLLKNLRLKDKRKAKEQERKYGCQMPLTDDALPCTDSYSLHEMYTEALQRPKSNTFGLAYTGLDKSHINLFSNHSKLVMTDRNNKKVSITGQAFGVGAFEEEDDDIYVKEDMTKYDFELVGEKQKKAAASKANLILDMFTRSQATPVIRNTIKYPAPSIPHSFTGKHKVKRSRFEPIVEPAPSTSKLNPSIRARYLGEEEVEEHTPSKPVARPKREEPPPESPRHSFLDSVFSDRFVSSSTEENVHSILEEVKKEEPIHGTEQMREAVRMKMFGPLTRETSDWNPGSLLCKRFNVPEPSAGGPAKQRTRTKNIIFQHQKHTEEEILPPGLKQEPETPTHTNQDTQESNIIEPQDTEMKSEPPPAQYVVDITEKIDLEQQQDLFKAIFLSSSESEDEPEEPTSDKAEATNKTEELKEAVLSENLLPKILPLRQGLLSGLSIHKFTKPTAKAAVEESHKEEKVEEENQDLYGPRVPERPVILEVKPVEVSSSEDEWVEKRRKHKKHKSKHKKNKKDKKSKRRD